jgi:hypothetical protein
MYEFLHECEEVIILSYVNIECKYLWPVLKDQGFTLHGDVFSFDRPNIGRPIWQAESYCDVHIYEGEKDIYYKSKYSHFNKIVLKYLLATQPRKGILVFSECAERLSKTLGLAMTFRGSIISREELTSTLQRFADELAAALGEPGSEEVAIFIESTYPRI